MNVLLVSQCEKRALTETRRILDQFAERCGDRVWQTPITKDGVDTLRKVLKKTARRNTAVACHWIHGKNHSDLLWIVGNAGAFNALGAVPTNTTARDILRHEEENDWHSAEDIKQLAVLASLFHDFGKASRAFQSKLKCGKPVADAYRHEWVSLRIFEAFVAGENDSSWLERLANLSETGESNWSERLNRDDQNSTKSPFSSLAPLAQVIAWLIVSHHRLPLAKEPRHWRKLKNLPAPIFADWNGAREDATDKEKAACWEFPHGVPFESVSWCRRANSSARQIIDRPSLVERASELLDDPYVMHLSRLTLMLADHHYSSLPSHSRYGDSDYPLHANTDHKTGTLKQRLDEHLIGVAAQARRVAGVLPRLEAQLPRLARHKGFQKRTTLERFRWQNKAYELATSVRERAAQGGFFGINMASTGCGKTLANGRIMYGLADAQKGTRFSIALGLRTLTLQTGQVYRERLALGEDDLAIVVGGAAVKELHNLSQAGELERTFAQCGSESLQELMEENSHVHYEANIEDGPLKDWLASNASANKLISAPILTCTIDHLVPATESARGGRQIAPMLRLLTSDLVLDEPDDFGMGDLPALTRLVHWAGLLGSRILLSSATLPPSLVQGLFEAYAAGRRVFEKNRGVPGKALGVCCAWFDEFKSIASDHASGESFGAAHHQFVVKRAERVLAEPLRRLALIQNASIVGERRVDVAVLLARRCSEWMLTLHDAHHSLDPSTGKRVSFGLIRMANIDPLIDVARELYQQGAPAGTRIHLCVYHSRHPLAVRAAIERQLDQALSRQNPDAVFALPQIRRTLDDSDEREHLFVVLASPVAEVGRDHDYDWAIVEPSSMRSIVQLAGRIRRHRAGACVLPNLFLLNQNIRGAEGKEVAFEKPGFEQAPDFVLETHALEDLLTGEQVGQINSVPRIVERPALAPKRNLVDLEHARLGALMLGEAEGGGLPVSLWWNTRANLSAELQRSQRFREGRPDERYAFLINQDSPDELYFAQNDQGRWVDKESIIRSVDLPQGSRICSWGTADLMNELERLADHFDRDLGWIAERYGTIQLEERTQGWRYHPHLGFQRQR